MSRLASLLALSLTAACGGGSPTMHTFAGVPGSQRFGAEEVPATQSELNLVVDLTFDSKGNAYVIDFNNHRIRVVDPSGTIRTVSGNGMLGDGVVIDGEGHEGPAMDVQWNHPTNLAFAPGDPDNLWVAAWHNSRVNRVDLARGWMHFEVGTGARAYWGDGGPGIDAALDLPSAITFDEVGNLYISDQANQVIRKVTPDGTISTLAGEPGVYGYAGDGGPASQARFHAHVGQAADPSSRILVHEGELYLADTRNQTIRAIDLTSGMIRRIAGNFESNGETDVLRAGGVLDYDGDGGDPLDARFANPRDIAFGPQGQLYIADTENHCVRVIHEGVIDTFAGTCGVAGNDGDGVPADEALLDTPYGIEVDADGNVYVADTYNHVVRVVRVSKKK